MPPDGAGRSRRRARPLTPPCRDYSFGVSPRPGLRKRLVLSAACAGLVLSASAAGAAKPPIAGRDILTGKRVALSQFAGKPVFVNVWARGATDAKRRRG